MTDLRTAGTHAAALAWVAFRAFATTLAAFAAIGMVLAGVAYYYLREPHVGYGVLAAVVALAEALAAGFFLGVARAKVSAIAHACGELRFGRSAVARIFETMMSFAGGRVAQGLERIPLARAEELLTRAVHTLTGEPEQGGWLRRTVRAALLKAVRRYTLSCFRSEDAGHRGIDLQKVRGALAETIDGVLVEKVRGGLRLWLWLAILGLPVAVAVQMYLAMGSLKS